MRTYSIRKSRHILKTACEWYQKKGKSLSSEQLNWLEVRLEDLDNAVLARDREKASVLAKEVEEFNKAHFKKNPLQYLWEMLVAIVIALAVATVVRQSWFELYEIPTGSMRPTFKEQDHLTVTKTAFGINVPLRTEHFYFDPSLVQRLSVVIWSGENVPNLDADAKFMNIIPYTKRFIKRNMGKPGDYLYFYGGKIYGLDKDGNDLKELRDNPWMAHLENIPFSNFEGGRPEYRQNHLTNGPLEAIFSHFNQPVGKLLIRNQDIQGQIFNGSTWVKDNPIAQREPHDQIETYSDFCGIRNFATARLLNKNQLEALTSYKAADLDEALLYLELRHTPSLSYPSPLLSNQFGAAIKGYTTIIPLQERHLKALMKNMYTCRFIIKNGRGTGYRQGAEKFSSSSPLFPKISDGSYEFYYGKAVKVGWGGVTSPLPADHPLYSLDAENVQKLFNLGIEMNTYVDPTSLDQPFFPNRYVYFRDGVLYAMGGVLMDGDDPILQSFLEREVKKQEASSKSRPYVAFKDYRPPIDEDGKIDKTFIKTFGYHVPEGKYVMLGDNHAMSQDSRFFGPVPAANLQGAPSIILWPPGDRWGFPNQKPYPLLTLPRLIIWSIAAIIFLIWWIIHRRNLKKPLFKRTMLPK